MSDAAKAIESILFHDFSIPQGQIDINIVDGVVYLRGTASSREQIAEIELRVEKVEGVEAVITLLRPPPTPARGPHDAPPHATGYPPLEAIQAAFARASPALHGRVLIVMTGRDDILARDLLFAWSPWAEGAQEKAIIARAVQRVAPRAHVYVYSGPIDAVLLGISPDHWLPLWRDYALRDHVVRVHDESAYLSAAVDKAARDSRAVQARITEQVQGARDRATLSGLAGMVQPVFALLMGDAEQLLQHYESLPEGTPIPSEDYRTAQSAIILRNVCGAVCGVLDRERGRWEAVGQLGELTARVLAALPRVIALETARLAALRNDLGPLLATAGWVRTSIARTGHIDRALLAAAADVPDRLLNELLAGAIPLALADIGPPQAGETIAVYFGRLRAEVVKMIGTEELEQTKPARRRNAAEQQYTSVPRMVSSDDEQSGLLMNDLVHGTISAEQEYIAIHTVLERVHQQQAGEEEHRMWLAAGLSERERAIMAYGRLGYKPKDIAPFFNTTPNVISVQKNRAKTKVQRYQGQHPPTGS